jgi:hypothetical protein
MCAVDYCRALSAINQVQARVIAKYDECVAMLSRFGIRLGNAMDLSILKGSNDLEHQYSASGRLLPAVLLR